MLRRNYQILYTSAPTNKGLPNGESSAASGRILCADEFSTAHSGARKFMSCSRLRSPQAFGLTAASTKVSNPEFTRTNKQGSTEW